MKNIKITKSKYFISGLIFAGLIMGTGAYASVTGAGTIGSLFEKVGDSYKFKGDNIVNGTITSEKIANGTITSEKIANGTIKKEDFDPSLELGVFKKDSSLAYYNKGSVGIGIEKNMDANGHLTVKGAKDISSVNKKGEGGFVIEDSADNKKGARMRIDANELQTSRDNKASSFYINQFGGNLVLGGSDKNNTQKIAINTKGSVSKEMISLRDITHSYRDGLYGSFIRGIDNSKRNVWYIGDGSSDKTLGIATYQDNYNVSLITKGIRRLNVMSNGNVGIGTNGPNSKLDVNGGLRVKKGNTNGDNTNLGYSFEKDGDTGMFAVGGRAQYNSDLIFKIDGKERFRIKEYNGVEIGDSNKTSGKNSVAMGYNTEASGDYSTAMGLYTKASGYYSIAMGRLAKASKGDSIAMGYLTNASGYHSIAMGYKTIAGGTNSTAMGNTTVAYATNSTAMGNATVANSSNSTAMGDNTRAYAANSLIIGKNGVSGYNSLFSIANGTYRDVHGVYRGRTSDDGRGIIFQVKTNGDVKAKGKIYSGGKEVALKGDTNKNEISGIGCSMCPMGSEIFLKYKKSGNMMAQRCKKIKHGRSNVKGYTNTAVCAIRGDAWDNKKINNGFAPTNVGSKQVINTQWFGSD